MKRATLVKGLLILVVALMAMVSAGPVLADGPAPPAPPPGKIPKLVPLKVISGPGGEVGTLDIRYGDCGYSWMWLTDHQYDDIGTARYGAYSSKGAIVHVSWEWKLFKGGEVKNSWSGDEWPWNATWFKVQDFDISPWGDGYYTGTLTRLQIWTAWGYYCVGLMPTDTQWIS